MDPKAGPDLMVAIGSKPSAGDSAGGMDSGEDCVPLSALNLPDDTEQMQAPEEGDKVQYTVEGTVTRIEGDNAYIKRESINGQPVEGDSNEPENPAEDAQEQGEEPGQEASGSSDDSELAALQDQASKTNLY